MSRASLAILDAIAKLNEEAAHPKLAARVGIDSGPVVVGEGAGKDADVFGDAPNIAARVQAAAFATPRMRRCSRAAAKDYISVSRALLMRSSQYSKRRIRKCSRGIGPKLARSKPRSPNGQGRQSS